jgi:hypothetical protein
VGGGPEVGLVGGFTPFWWSVTETGIYFLAREPDFDAVNLYDPATQKVTCIGRLPFRVPFSVRFAVSPNARWAITGEEHTEQDLMLLDGFH